MKTTKLDFLWFEEEDRRKVLRASVCADCKLHIGEELRKKLSTPIRYGFDKTNRILAVTSGQGSGIAMPKNGIVNAGALCKQLREIGLMLPVVFEFEKDAKTGFYLGHIVPQRQANKEKQYDIGQLLVIYQPLIDQTINHLAKTTPKAERKAIAASAICEAMQNYDESCGDLKTYLEEYLQRCLITENRKYTEEYRNLHLDSPVCDDQDKCFTLYNMLSDQNFDGIAQVENRIMAEQFLNSLSKQEQKLVRLMSKELKLQQIALELELSQDEVIEMGRNIGKKREAFYTVA